MGFFGVKLGCHATNIAPFTFSISTSKKGKKRKCELLTIQAETVPKCSVFTNSMRTEEWLNT